MSYSKSAGLAFSLVALFSITARAADPAPTTSPASADQQEMESWWAEAKVARLTDKTSWTRAVRGIVLLEHIGTPEAVAIIKDMAGGHPDAQPTKVAKEALAAH